jgi:hypothetical protein
VARIRRLTGGRAWAARLSALFVLAAIVALIVAVVPVLGADDDGVPDVIKVEEPLGGEGDDCSALVQDLGYPHLADLEDFRVENPQNDTFTDPVTGADFTLNGLVGGGKEFDWSTAHLVHAIVVKGGAKSVVYDYVEGISPPIPPGGPAPGPISSDEHLSAPDKDKGKGTFNVSHVSFCYELVVADISGTVWHDHDQNGVIGGTADEDAVETAGQKDWTINLYDSDGFVAFDTTDVNGDYSFPLQPVGETYTICEIRDPLSSQWGQSAVAGGNWQTRVCNGTEEEPDGHVITLTTLVDDADFGNFNTVNVTCGITIPDPPVGDHVITLPTFASGLCLKPPGEYVFEVYTRVDLKEVHDFKPLGGFEPDEVMHVTEVHVFSLEEDKEQETGRTLMYDDGKGEAEALLCLVNPIDPDTGELDPDLVGDEALEQSDGPSGGPHTTCIITFTKNSDDSTTFFLYSKIDGRRIY